MKYYLSAILLFVGLGLSAQTSIEFHVAPALAKNFYTLGTDGQIPVKDSLSGMDNGRSSIGFGLRLRTELNREWSLQTGIQYSNFGFQRKREGLVFHDTIHPELGWLKDLSDNGLKVATYDYRFKYISIPLFFHYDVSPKYKRQLYQISVFGGLRGHYFLKDDIYIFLQGFSINGESEHTIDPSEFEMKQIAATTSFGGRFQIALPQDFFFSIQPNIEIPLYSQGSYDDLGLNNWLLGADFGINYNF